MRAWRKLLEGPEEEGAANCRWPKEGRAEDLGRRKLVVLMLFGCCFLLYELMTCVQRPHEFHGLQCHRRGAALLARWRRQPALLTKAPDACRLVLVQEERLVLLGFVSPEFSLRFAFAFGFGVVVCFVPFWWVSAACWGGSLWHGPWLVLRRFKYLGLQLK